MASWEPTWTETQRCLASWFQLDIKRTIDDEHAMSLTAGRREKRSVIDVHRVIILTNLFEVLKNFLVMKVLWRPLRQDPEGIPQDGDGCHQYNAGEHQGADGIDDLKKRKL